MKSEVRELLMEIDQVIEKRNRFKLTLFNKFLCPLTVILSLFAIYQFFLW